MLDIILCCFDFFSCKDDEQKRKRKRIEAEEKQEAKKSVPDEKPAAIMETVPDGKPAAVETVPDKKPAAIKTVLGDKPVVEKSVLDEKPVKLETFLDGKPAAKGTVPDEKPAAKGTVPDEKPAAKGTVPDEKPVVLETFLDGKPAAKETVADGKKGNLPSDQPEQSPNLGAPATLGHAEVHVQQEATGNEEKCQKENIQGTSQSKSTGTVPSQGNVSMLQVSGTYIITTCTGDLRVINKGNKRPRSFPLQMKALRSNQVRFQPQPHRRRRYNIIINCLSGAISSG